MSKPHLKLLDAAWCHYRSKLMEAEANLDIYLERMEAVPDHSSALKEIMHWTEKIAHAQMALEVLKKKWEDGHKTWSTLPPWRCDPFDHDIYLRNNE
jgi:hypothetical protein